MNKIFSFLKQFNLQSAKKYRFDILLLLVFCIGGFLFAHKPDSGVRARQIKENISEPMPKPAPERKTPEPAGNMAAPAPGLYTKLEEKNIFSPSGGYEVTKDLMRIPENPYNLIAILRGAEKRIVIREFTGDLVSVKEGGALIDGAVVKKIDDNVVTLKKGDTTKELKILDYKELAARKPVVITPTAGSSTVQSGNVPPQRRPAATQPGNVPSQERSTATQSEDAPPPPSPSQRRPPPPPESKPQQQDGGGKVQRGR